MFKRSLLYGKTYQMFNGTWQLLFGGCMYNLDSPVVVVLAMLVGCEPAQDCPDCTCSHQTSTSMSY